MATPATAPSTPKPTKCQHPRLQTHTFSDGTAIYYCPDCPKFNAARQRTLSIKTKDKRNPARGLPGENLPTKLYRSFLVGVARRDTLLQKRSYMALVTIAGRAAGRKEETASGLDPHYATALVLAKLMSGKTKANPAYFPKLIKQIYADDYRKNNTLKRGRGIRFVSFSDVADTLSADKLPAKPTGPRMTSDDLNADANRMIAMSPRSTKSRPAGHQSRWEIRKFGKL
jgi:hypothetical protein